VLGLAVLVTFVIARFAAFVASLRRVIGERFGLGIATILLGGVIAILTLAPQLAALVFWPAPYAAVIVVLDVIPLVAAWRREHAAAQGSDDEARAGRIVAAILPLAILDAGRLIVVLLTAWMTAD
jgi:hypothetical protein